MFLLFWFERFGRVIIYLLEDIGGTTVLFFKSVYFVFARPFKPRRIIEQMVHIGVDSVPVVILTAVFTGMVLALQATYQIAKFGADIYIGGIVGISMTRELGPVLTALMVSGRVGAAIAAEIGTMKVTEQVDALETLATNPVQYLVMPRVVAAAIMLPTLTALADFVGIAGGYVIGDKPGRIYREDESVGPGERHLDRPSEDRGLRHNHRFRRLQPGLQSQRRRGGRGARDDYFGRHVVHTYFAVRRFPDGPVRRQ
jgi:ABC-type transporter Mla maintaining outer membrane lipid asymmetry permease subunit MlaE